MICEKCNKQKAKAYFKTKKVCEDCFFELSNMKSHKRNYVCVVCKKDFITRRNQIIPLCSTKCRNRIKKNINKQEDALNEKLKAICGGVEI
jgi:hypothetical protein